MPTVDIELEQLLDEALRQARARRPARREKDETHLDYAKRLAEKGLYRRLAREANAQMDSLRFEFWFLNDGAEGLTLDQWRAYIDIQMENFYARQASLVASSSASVQAPPVAQAEPNRDAESET